MAGLIRVAGGIMPEPDFHAPDPKTPDTHPVSLLPSRSDTWHNYRPDVEEYTPGMKRARHLTLEGSVCDCSLATRPRSRSDRGKTHLV
jgi:hypothetical protein